MMEDVHVSATVVRPRLMQTLTRLCPVIANIVMNHRGCFDTLAIGSSILTGRGADLLCSDSMGKAGCEWLARFHICASCDSRCKPFATQGSHRGVLAKCTLRKGQKLAFRINKRALLGRPQHLAAGRRDTEFNAISDRMNQVSFLTLFRCALMVW